MTRNRNMRPSSCGAVVSMTLSFIQKTVAGAEKEGLLEAVERYGETE